MRKSKTLPNITLYKGPGWYAGKVIEEKYVILPVHYDKDEKDIAFEKAKKRGFDEPEWWK